MAQGKHTLSAKAKAVDPVLDALFSASAGPVVVPSKSRYAALLPPRERAPAKKSDEVEGSDEDEDDSSQAELEEDNEDEGEEMDDSDDNGDASSDSDAESDLSEVAVERAEAVAAKVAQTDRKRKRTVDRDNEDLESRYLEKVMANEQEPAGKRRKSTSAEDGTEPPAVADEESDSDAAPPVHESLADKAKDQDLERAARTVFLSNVSSSAVSSKSAKKTLLSHLSSVLDKDAKSPQKVESLRFRSVAFSTASIPKRAAFITGATMDATTKSTNAYAVYSTTAAARAAVAKLNGTVVLDRHLRADSVAHPAPVAHRSCVFVGNLGFVDDETLINTTVGEDGKEVTEKKKRTKTPMDVEEGLWRTFGEHAGKVESVRVVRDQGTRVGKGIAYVQFYDANSVEAALLLAGKKFPPMLPRELRVTRCKAPHKTARALDRSASGKTIAAPGKKVTGYVRKVTAEEQTLAGRTGKLLGRSAAVAAAQGLKSDGKRKKRIGDRKERRFSGADEGGETTFKTPEAIMFEGRRASAKDGKPGDLKFKGANKGTKGARARASNNRKRQATRTANWRKEKSS